VGVVPGDGTDVLAGVLGDDFGDFLRGKNGVEIWDVWSD